MNEKVASEMNSALHAAFRALMEHSTDLVFFKNTQLVYLAVSPAFVRMTGKQCAQEIIGRTDFEVFEDRALAERCAAADRQLLEQDCDQIGYIEPLAQENGTPRCGMTSKYIVRGEDGSQVGILGISRDITREYNARQHYLQEVNYLLELPENSYAAVLIDVDDWRVTDRRTTDRNGFVLPEGDGVEPLCRMALESFVDPNAEAAQFYRNFSRETLTAVYESGKSRMTLSYLRRMPDGTERWVRSEIRFLTNPENGHLCALIGIQDIDEKKRSEQALIQAAKTDGMTGLLNRDSTMQAIREILIEGGERQHALFMIDVDNFKLLNDTLGHQEGDRFLAALAEEFRRCFRESDVVGRVGGDEFFALMRSVPGLEAAENKAGTLLRAIRTVCADYPELNLSGSIGISIYPRDGSNLDELYLRADEALYQSKAQGKDRFAVARQPINKI